MAASYDPEPVPLGEPACYLCGSSDRLTREHVPAKGLFPKPRPSNLHTIPCCETCNNSASQDDEYFRLAVSAVINRNALGARSWQRVTESTLSKRRIGKLIDELRRTVRPGVLITPRGRIPASEIGARADVVSRVLVRITKGFLYLTHPEIDRASLDFHLTQIHQFKLDSIIRSGVADRFTHYSIGDGVYRHWRALAVEDNRVGMWVHMFYDAGTWLVQHRPGDGRMTIQGASNWEQRLVPLKAN